AGAFFQEGILLHPSLSRRTPSPPTPLPRGGEGRKLSHLVSSSSTVFLPALMVHSSPDVLIAAYFAGSVFGPNLPSAVDRGLPGPPVMPYWPAGRPSKAV